MRSTRSCAKARLFAAGWGRYRWRNHGQSGRCRRRSHAPVLQVDPVPPHHVVRRGLIVVIVAMAVALHTPARPLPHQRRRVRLRSAANEIAGSITVLRAGGACHAPADYIDPSSLDPARTEVTTPSCCPDSGTRSITQHEPAAVRRQRPWTAGEHPGRLQAEL